MRVACMVDNEVQLQCVKRKMIKRKFNVNCPKEHHSRSAAVEGIMSHDTRKCRVKKHDSGIQNPAKNCPT